MSEEKKRAGWRRAGFIPVMLILLGAVGLLLWPFQEAQGGGTEEETMTESVSWKEIERLISEDKFQAALEKASSLRQQAEEAGDSDEWTRALVKEVQLQIGLHGYETAVRRLHEQTLPKPPLELEPHQQAAVRLFYASSLVTYLRQYSFEIRQRERVASDETVDLKQWTQEQIVSEAWQGYETLWSERDAWGAEPLGRLAEYIDQNSYPARIRGTLRDAVTYLWVELLADTSLWRAEQSNETYRLKLDRLLADDPAAESAIDLSDPDVHPLLKLTTILADLERWHGADRPEAAFEARLERLRRLDGSFSREDDRKHLRTDLEARLDALGQRYGWWAMGMAQLAQHVRRENQARSEIEAREIAKRGADAYPRTPGGERCANIVATIEAPSYEITAMATDNPGKRSIQVSHRNLDRLYFRAYSYDLMARLESAKARNLLPSYQDVPKIMARQRPDAAWSIDLPATPDYRTHRTFVTPPIKRPGAYLVIASAREDFEDTFNHKVAVQMLIGDLVLFTQQFENELEVTVRSGASGDALEGVDVTLWQFDWQGGHRPVRTLATDAHGQVRFPFAGSGRRGYRESFFVVARHGDELTLDQNRLMPRYPQESQRITSALVYTDRAVYRPQQTLHWKVVAYEGATRGSRFETISELEMTVELFDPNYQAVAKATVSTNDFGSASGSFDIPVGRLLGDWTLNASISGGTSIKVEEYKRPTFEVEFKDPEQDLRLNRDAEFVGEARYYFGLPVTAGTAEWQVTRQPVYPIWGRWSYAPWIDRQSPQLIASGQSPLETNGTFRVSFVPEADERLAEDPGVTYRYEVRADVTDEGGETRSSSRSFRLGFVAVETQINGASGFIRADEATHFSLHRTDLNGVPQEGPGEWRLIALESPEHPLLPAEQPAILPPDENAEAFHTPGDRLRPRWASVDSVASSLSRWSDGEVHDRGTVEHNAQGEATVEFSDLKPGAWRLRYTTRDAFGGTFERAQEFLIMEDGATLALPSVLLAEQDSVAVGETARFLVHSGLDDLEMVFEIFRDGERIDRRNFRSGGAQIIEIPVRREDHGGFSVRLTSLRDHQFMTDEQHVFVPWDERELTVEFETFRDKLRPGARENWRIKVRGADEATLDRGAAELIAYMYDRSLDIFAVQNPPRPLQLYPHRTGVNALISNLGQAPLVWRGGREFVRLPRFPSFRGDRLKFYEGRAIGGPGVRMRQRVMKARPGGAPKTMAMPPAAPQASAAPIAESLAMDSMAVESVESDAIQATAAFDGGGPPQIESEEQAPTEAAPLRENFAETAFWEPHLLLDEDGTATLEFDVPDSVTEWRVFVQALTRDLRAGTLTQETRSVKELLVRPYMPRFLREGDRAELEVVINNAGDEPFSGDLDLAILDPQSGVSRLADFGLDPTTASGRRFQVDAGGSTSLRFPLIAPRHLGEVSFEVVGRAGAFSDGERRPLVILPSRLHLAQSRFAALQDADRRVLEFTDMRADDPTLSHDQLVVTLDAQLFYSVLNAVPYLLDYPYDCTEQVFNRYLSSGILTRIFDEHPTVAAMAEKMAARDTPFEPWQEDDPNRKMLLEESPWLQLAQGGAKANDHELIRLLDPEIAATTRRVALRKLEEAQTASGGFPWWPGGPPSPYITLYLLHGFSKALEFGVDMPQGMIVRAWQYLHQHYLKEMVREMQRKDCCFEQITFLNYVLSAYPDPSWTGGVFTADDRRKMLKFSFENWRRHSPLLKSYLALTLQRSGRADDAKLVFDSVMDSARTTRDEGTFWAPEDRAWLWYNDTIETHAFALRTLSELEPNDARRQGLVHWLMLNKKLNHWKSTRATAEVLYSLTHYLKQEDQLAVREEARVTIGPLQRDFVFEPDEYTGRGNQVLVPGSEVETATMSEIVIEKSSPGLMFASATWHFATDTLPEEARGDFFHVERTYYRRVNDGREWILEPLAEGTQLAVGDQLEVHLSLRTKHAAEYVHLRDPRGAGFEPESTSSGYRWDLGLGYYEEIRDSGSNFFFEWLPVGEYTFKYRLRANLAGAFRVGPATIQSLYAPEFVAYSSGALLAIEPGTEP